MTTPVPPRVILGVGGGIAAYKACELLRGLTESGHQVTVVPTAAALRFVGEPTWAALSGRPVATGVFTDAHRVPHVRLGREADLVVVAPATADLLARAAHGLADDLLTNTLLTARCPVLFAPAMHTEMWEHPATRDNVALLRRRGAMVIEPAVGRLTGADSGKGRLPDPRELLAACRRVLDRGAVPPADLAGRRVLITAGGTREAVDPVRYLGNRSSGRQGFALARTARDRGAEVTLVVAATEAAPPEVDELVAVDSAAELRTAVLDAAERADVIVMSAAVADFRPAEYAPSKIKKRDGEEPAPLRLTRNADILAEISAHRARPGQVVVGFGAETDDVLAHGRDKLARKGCDLLVVNQVGVGRVFGQADTEATVLAADGPEVPVPGGTKDALADVVWDLVAERLPGSPTG